MKVEIIVVGELLTNCYIVTINNHLYIIDPGDEASRIIDFIGGRRVDAILVTHNHFDHIGALKELENYYSLEANTNVIDFEVIDTPGHTLDSKTFYNKEYNAMFDGDFIFKGTIGRTDLGGKMSLMFESIEKILKYNHEITLYPGHGDKTTIEAEYNNLKRYV